MNSTIFSNPSVRNLPSQPLLVPSSSSPLLFGSNKVAAAQPADSINLGGKQPVAHKPQNIVWVTTERLPAKVGGLGEVSKTIPEAIAEHLPKKDVRIIVPYLKEHRDEDKAKKEQAAQGAKDVFQETGLKFDITHKQGKTYEVEVLQKFEPATGLEGKTNAKGQPYGNWIYALRCDALFIGRDKKNNEVGLSQYTYSPNAGEFDKIMFFNKAAAAFIPHLNRNRSSSPKLETFNNHFKATDDPHRQSIDMVVAHDWLSGPVLSELEADENTKKVFMVHNKYDKMQTPDVSQRIGLFTPERLFSREECYSALRMGVEPADAVIVNDNFENTLLETHLGNGEPFVEALRLKKQAGRTFSMHHGLSASFNPTGVKDDKGRQIKPESKDETALKALVEEKQQALNKLQKISANTKSQNFKEKHAIFSLEQEIEAAKTAVQKGGYEFEYLKVAGAEPTDQEIQAFKAANKKALQRKLGLKEDPNAIIFGWAARLEPRQKGFYLLQQSMEAILEKYDNAQFVIFGPNDDPAIGEWIQKITRTYGGRGEKRVHIPNKFASKEEVLQLNSASDFTVLPSIYEPYGLTQLEAMKMGSIPVVHGVDGLRTTVNDPEVVETMKKSNPPVKPETVWEKPQNGILMEPFDIDAYGEYVNARMDFEKLESLYKKLKNPEEGQKKNAYVGDLTLILKSATKRYKHLIKLEQADVRRHSARASKANATIRELQAKIDGVEELTQQIEFQQVVTPQLFEEIKQLVGPDEAIQQQEAAKLQTAMERAIQLTKPVATQIRLDALKYVNVEHDWSALVTNYYKEVFEKSTLDEASRARHKEEFTAFRMLQKAKKMAEAALEYVNVRKSDLVETSKNLGSQIMRALKDFWILQSKFWEAIGRIFSLRKD